MVGVQVIGAVVIVAAALADATVAGTWLTPEFLQGLAILITAVTGLIVALRASNTLATAAVTAQATHAVVQSTNDTVAQVAVQTNGQMETLQKRNIALEAELAGVAHRSEPRAPPDPAAAPT